MNWYCLPHLYTNGNSTQNTKILRFPLSQIPKQQKKRTKMKGDGNGSSPWLVTMVSRTHLFWMKSTLYMKGIQKLPIKLSFELKLENAMAMPGALSPKFNKNFYDPLLWTGACQPSKAITVAHWCFHESFINITLVCTEHFGKKHS